MEDGTVFSISSPKSNRLPDNELSSALHRALHQKAAADGQQIKELITKETDGFK